MADWRWIAEPADILWYHRTYCWRCVAIVSPDLKNTGIPSGVIGICRISCEWHLQLRVASLWLSCIFASLQNIQPWLRLQLLFSLPSCLRDHFHGLGMDSEPTLLSFQALNGQRLCLLTASLFQSSGSLWRYYCLTSLWISRTCRIYFRMQILPVCLLKLVLWSTLLLIEMLQLVCGWISLRCLTQKL